MLLIITCTCGYKSNVINHHMYLRLVMLLIITCTCGYKSNVINLHVHMSICCEEYTCTSKEQLPCEKRNQKYHSVLIHAGSVLNCKSETCKSETPPPLPPQDMGI